MSTNRIEIEENCIESDDEILSIEEVQEEIVQGIEYLMTKNDEKLERNVPNSCHSKDTRYASNRLIATMSNTDQLRSKPTAKERQSKKSDHRVNGLNRHAEKNKFVDELKNKLSSNFSNVSMEPSGNISISHRQRLNGSFSNVSMEPSGNISISHRQRLNGSKCIAMSVPDITAMKEFKFTSDVDINREGIDISEREQTSISDESESDFVILNYSKKNPIQSITDDSQKTSMIGQSQFYVSYPSSSYPLSYYVNPMVGKDMYAILADICADMFFLEEFDATTISKLSTFINQHAVNENHKKYIVELIISMQKNADGWMKLSKNCGTIICLVSNMSASKSCLWFISDNDIQGGYLTNQIIDRDSFTLQSINKEEHIKIITQGKWLIDYQNMKN